MDRQRWLKIRAQPILDIPQERRHAGVFPQALEKRLAFLRIVTTEVYWMIGRRAERAGIGTKIGCHTFRATGITEYLRNGGKLETAQQMAKHKSSRTTSFYDHPMTKSASMRLSGS